MAQISRDTLLTLEAYSKQRKDFRTRVITHKKNRMVHLGEHVTLIFEDDGIEDELQAYNPLIPDGTNLKATMQIEFEDPIARARELARLKGIEHRVYVQVDGHPRVYAIADEDLERSNEQKTSAVHFLRFDLTAPMIDSFKRANQVAIGIDVPVYDVRVDEIAPEVQAALARDFA